MEGAAEPEKKGRVELEVEIENFGPISSGKVRLRPLTVFIGPNNSGKSYTAMLIRCARRPPAPSQGCWH